MKPGHRFALLAIAVALVALLLTGCGGTTETNQANHAWANAACTSALAWKTQLHHDETSLNLGLSPSARLNEAVAATRHLAKELTRLGLPKTQATGHTRAHPAASDSPEQITDLGLAMLQTRVCRQLAGSPL